MSTVNLEIKTPGELLNEIARLRDFVNWVDSWVSNPVGSYSVSALDGLFGMTRDRIAELTPHDADNRGGVEREYRF